MTAEPSPSCVPPDVDPARPLLPQLVARCAHPLTATAAVRCMVAWGGRDVDPADDPMPGCWALLTAYRLAVRLGRRDPGAQRALAVTADLDRALVREIVESEPAGRLARMDGIEREAALLDHAAELMRAGL